MTGITLKLTVESMFDVIKDRSTKDELYFVCPQPGCGDQTGNRSVNLRSGKTNCWRCNRGGDFVMWARFLGYQVSDDGTTQAEPLEDLSLDATRDEEQPLPVVRDVRLPDGFCFCHEHPKSIYTELIAEMAERKNLTIEDLFEAKVGYTKSDPKWEPYAIFPVFEDGRVVYYQGRTYVDVPGEPTKRFPDRQECPNSSKFWIYNIDELRRSKAPVVMVMESILNVLTMRWFLRERKIAGVVPICVFKHYLSKPQARKLTQIAHLQEICLLYDHDATRSSWEKSPMLSDRIKVTVAEMPPGPGGAKNDPNDDPEAAWAAFEKRQESDVMANFRYRFDFTPPAPKRGPGLPPPTNPLDNLGL